MKLRSLVWMLPVVTVATFSVTALGQLAHADCKDPFGKPEEVLDFHLKMSRADWLKLRDSKVRNVDGLPPNSEACNDNFPEFAAEFRCGDEPWIKVAVRKKRGTERGTEALEKPPLKIDFNEDFMGMQPSAKGQRWPANMGDLGYRKLTLNNGQGNKPAGRTLMLPLLMTEHVALRLLKREVPAAPGTAYAKVIVHTDDKPDGEYHGIYILIEDIDRTAIRRRWGDAQGRLSKMSKDNCSPQVEYDDGPPNETFPAFTSWLAKTPAAGDPWIEETSKVIDLDAYLRQEAIREILVNGDDTISYVTTSPFMKEGNNFFAFDPRKGPRQYMPWDVDLTFGQQNENCAPTNLMCQPTQPLFRYCSATQSRVGKATVCHPAVQKRYLEIMCQLTNGTMAPGEILKIWEQVNTAVRPHATAEKDLIWGGKDPADPATPKSFGAEYARLKSWIPARIASVRQQIAQKGVTCAAGCTAGEKQSCSHLGCGGERRCEGGLWTPCLPAASCTKPAPGADGGAPASDGGPPVDAGAGGSAGNGGAGSGGVGGGGGPTSGSGGGSPSSGGGSTGSGGPATSGGSGPSGSTGGRSGSGGSQPPPAPPSGGGSSSGCQIGGGADRPAALTFALGAFVILAGRRRRRSS